MKFQGLSQTTKFKYKVLLVEKTCSDQTMTQEILCKSQEDAFAAINELKKRYKKQRRAIEITYERVKIISSKYLVLDEE